ncbi:hypothetical protein E2C01_010326 [Portunus trituberculatus]|uniref:Uncharacterized protein n=1 Tax=Portunus trituberculatus TaxID=210409 RepID=A0A5B7D831_PORTR|nr:hypothetical protein [Portunus trituberculatus]
MMGRDDLPSPKLTDCTRLLHGLPLHLAVLFSTTPQTIPADMEESAVRGRVMWSTRECKPYIQAMRCAARRLQICLAATVVGSKRGDVALSIRTIKSFGMWQKRRTALVSRLVRRLWSSSRMVGDCGGLTVAVTGRERK